MIKLTDVWDNDRIQSYIDNGYQVVRCPVCGNEAFDHWAICPHCAWEHDELLNNGYSYANGSYIWWYKVRYKFKKLFKNS